MLGEACDRLGIQQQEIERLKAENNQLRGEEPIPGSWWYEAPKLAQKVLERTMAENDRLRAENAKLKQDIEHLHGQGQAQGERIEKLTEQKEVEAGGAKVLAEVLAHANTERNRLTTENTALKRELLERGGHSRSCHNQLLHGAIIECCCGWDARREQVEAEIKKGE